MRGWIKIFRNGRSMKVSMRLKVLLHIEHVEGAHIYIFRPSSIGMII